MKEWTVLGVVKAIGAVRAVGVVLCSLVLASNVNAETYESHPEAKKLIAEMVNDHQYDEKKLQRIFSKAKKKQSILDAISRPAERTKTWAEYRPMFVNKTRISKGLEFWKKHQEILKRSEQIYGVPPEIIVAIIGVETMYGRQGGSYRVIDALSTLAFDYPKRPLFRRELISYLLLVRKYDLDPMKIKGSYAGAMGYGQFIPSSYMNYAVDFDGDGFKDIWTSSEDAIGSVANYIKRHGWKTGAPLVSRARVNNKEVKEMANETLKPGKTLAEWQALGIKAASSEDYESSQKAAFFKYQGRLGAEFWFGFDNFYTVTRYNHSRLYAMSVIQLADEIKRQMP